MIPEDWLRQAAHRIAPFIHRTPVTFDSRLDLYFKWENRQVTGSFKARGAFNKIFSLQPWERERGLVAASAGNHGQGVALAGRMTGVPVTIFCSAEAVPAKIEAMRSLGAQVNLIPGGYGEAERAALEYAAASQATWISPYNDGQVIAGQATLVEEVKAELLDLANATWLVPVGGGGLISGIGAALERGARRERLIGVQSTASAFMHALYRKGSQEGTADLPTLADGLAGPVAPDSLTIPLVRRFVDDFVLVDEEEIAAAIAFAWTHYGETIEGAAAVGLAAVLSGRIEPHPGVVIISGGKIQPEAHSEIIARRQTRALDG
jgi:threonine dehydratase